MGMLPCSVMVILGEGNQEERLPLSVGQDLGALPLELSRPLIFHGALLRV